MITGIRPIGADPLLAEQSGGDVAMRQASQRPVKRAEDKTQSAATAIRRKQPNWKLAVGLQGIETLKRTKSMPDLIFRPKCVDLKPVGPSHIDAIIYQLDTPNVVLQQNSLDPIAEVEDVLLAWQPGKFENAA